MLNLVASIHGHELVQEISEQFTCDRVRTEQDPQRAPLKYLIGASQPRLVDAVVLMEANIEEPLSSTRWLIASVFRGDSWSACSIATCTAHPRAIIWNCACRGPACCCYRPRFR